MGNDLKKIKYQGTTLVINPDAENIGYTNALVEGVTNAKGALDNLVGRVNAIEAGDSGIRNARFVNFQLPTWKNNVKILCIGNSLTIFPLFELANLLNGIGNITENDLLLRDIHSAGRTMAEWLQKLKNNSNDNQCWKWRIDGGAWKAGYDSVALSSLVEGTEWDIIMLQDFPTSTAGNYAAFRDTLYEMVTELRSRCPNKKVCIAWSLIYPQANPNTSRQTYMGVWQNVAEATRQMVADSGIDIIVPMGTAYANAVNTATFDGATHAWLERDGTHPAMGVSAFIGSCVFYESLIAPMIKKSFMDVATLYPMYEYYQAPTYTQAEFNVTQQNLPLIQAVVLSALKDMYHVNYDIDPIQQS